MHCASCERLIEGTLKEIEGVEEVEASLSKQKVGIRWREDASPLDLAALNLLLAPHGYQLFEKSVVSPVTCELPGAPPKWSTRFWRAFLAFLFVAILWKFFVLPLRSYIPNINAGASFLALFLFGVIASVSTCLATTGAFILAYSAEQANRRRILWVHAGRLLAFAVGGALLGAIGGAVPSSPLAYGLMAIVLGVGFLVVGLHFLQFTPSLASLGVRLPRRFSVWADRATKSRSPLAPFLVGAITFILPCGFTQTAQALALASGSFTRGAFLMLAFALGTLPVLLGISFFGSMARFRHWFVRAAVGVVLCIFAFGQIDGALTVLGASFTLGGAWARMTVALRGAARPGVAQAQEQVVNMTVAYGAFTPDRFTIKEGVPVRWEVNGVDISGCASSIVSPKLGINRSLVVGENVIRFTPKKTGVIPFSCSMGMIRGSFTVVE